MLRKITSLTALLSFLVTLTTSVVLYIVPHGRVAYWADWTFLGLSKDQWDGTHITVGTLFIVALLLHVWLNWKPLMAYMKNKARQMVVLTGPMIVSVAITLFVFFGTLLGLPPMQQILDFGASIKDDAVKTYGNPPFGHAELSPLDKFCGYLGLDVEKAVAALKAAGYTLEKGAATELKDIARSRGVSPQHVFEDIRGGLGGDPFGRLPADPPQGLGRMAFSEVCAGFGLPVEDAIARLKAKSVNATPEMTIKDIAAGSDMKPRDVYEILRGN
ncbi:DUF4405 domain-containing protein [Pseudodesulfovibrio sp.]|uniref:DUF4405 domain-containing protein n=1 Tax=Pseudodesulfovibrio sp. TaxID=2035812 RepID=UPI0026323E7A|nr:DUF4405 domain-containing protein [Pseudodesulfovibrio sp.]MDD3310752.1 DUF4405 domain-containing protein [Pseudodesulfovibrio sp.]